MWQKAPKYPEGMGRVKDYFGKIEIDGVPVRDAVIYVLAEFVR